MKDLLSKGLLFGLVGISAIMGALFMFEVLSAGAIIAWCYVLLVLATVASVGFSLINLGTNMKAAKGTLIGVGALVLVFVISYAAAGSDVPTKLADMGVTEGEVKWSGAGLITFYVLFGLAIVAAIYSGVTKMIK